MKGLLLNIAFALAIGAGSCLSEAQAQTIYSRQDTSLNTTGGTKLSAVACTAVDALRWTGWLQVDTYRNASFDIDFVDGDASAANLTVRCESSRSSATVADAGRDLPIIVSTATTGINTLVPQAQWRYVSSTGAAPGTFSTTLYISNIPAPFVECLFTCGAGALAADTITVFARGVTP